MHGFQNKTSRYRRHETSTEKCTDSSALNPTVPEGHKHRITTPENPRRTPQSPAEPSVIPPQSPLRDPCRALWETPAEPSERQISSDSLAEGCSPRMVTLRKIRIEESPTGACLEIAWSKFCFSTRVCRHSQAKNGKEMAGTNTMIVKQLSACIPLAHRVDIPENHRVKPKRAP